MGIGPNSTKTRVDFQHFSKSFLVHIFWLLNIHVRCEIGLGQNMVSSLNTTAEDLQNRYFYIKTWGNGLYTKLKMAQGIV